MKLLILVCFVLLAEVLPAQNIPQYTVADFYPKTKQVNFAREESFISIDTIICLEGNCNEGKGSKLYLQVYRYHTVWTDWVVKLFKGTFSDSSRKFDGKIYEARNQYWENDRYKQWTPRDSTIDFSDEEKLKKYLMKEGEFAIATYTNDNYSGKPQFKADYIFHGKATDHRILRKDTAIANYIGLYKVGRVTWARITYKGTERMKEFTGFTSASLQPLAGKALYKDGSAYEGFFKNDNFYGPGKFADALKVVKEGLWDMGVLKTPKKVPFPKAFYEEPKAEREGKTISYKIDDSTYSGIYTGTEVAGQPEGPGLIWGKNSFLFSDFKAGQMGEERFFYHVLQRNQSFTNRMIYAFDETNETIMFGRYENNKLASGQRIRTTHTRTTENLKGEVATNRDLTTWLKDKWMDGSYINGQLNGCGMYQELSPENNRQFSYKVEGKWREGKISGWVRVTLPEGLPYGHSHYFKSSGYKYMALDWEDFEMAKEITPAHIQKALNDTGSCFVVPTDERMAVIAQAEQRMQTLAAAANKPAPVVEEDCVPLYQSMHKQSGLRVGSTIIAVTFPSEANTYIIQGYDCKTDLYYLLYKASKNGGKESHFLVKSLPGTSIRGSYVLHTSQYKVCSECEGAGKKDCILEYTTGGKWEQVNFNIHVMKKEKTISYRSKCDCIACKGKGWLAR